MATELYLITGFLGAGKSTLLKKFIRLFAGRKVQLIINEFGRAGIDGTLLTELDVELSEITGGSVFCSCRIDQFVSAIEKFVADDTEVVLVETSGLSDPTGVRGLFGEGRQFPAIAYKGAICLIDAVRFPKIYAKSRTATKQLASSDVLIVNKIDKATPEQLQATEELVRAQRPDLPLIETRFGQIDMSILDQLAGQVDHAAAPMPLTADLTLRKMLLTFKPGIERQALEKCIRMFLEVTFRVKGFVQTAEGLVLVDAVGTDLVITPYAGAVRPELIGKLVILSGAKMPMASRVKEAARWYEQDVADLQAGDQR